MPRRISNRQKPVWKQIRKPLPPPGRPQTTRKGKKAYNRKDKSWKKAVVAIAVSYSALNGLAGGKVNDFCLLTPLKAGDWSTAGIAAPAGLETPSTYIRGGGAVPAFGGYAGGPVNQPGPVSAD